MVIAVHTAYLHYDGDPVPFPVSLYATQASIARAMEPVLRWNGMLHGGYELAHIPGEHFTLWDEEHVGGLAAALHCSLSHAGPTTAR
jgi:thioesterase domain-containing protein